MQFTNLWSWLGGRDAGKRPSRRKSAKFRPVLSALEDRTVMNGYVAVGAGAGAQPLVAIRVDKQSLTGGTPNNAGEPVPPSSDGRTDYTSQTFLAYDKSFVGGVHVASGNFDGDYTTPDFLITAPGAGGGPHVKIWTMVDDGFGNLTVGRLFTEFMAFNTRFIGGVNVATGDLDGDGRAELIVAAGPGGGPHVKIYKLDISDQKAVLVNEFMAYEPSFRGGVNISSGQGYQTPIQVRQILGGDFPDNFFQYHLPPANPLAYPESFQGVPNAPYTQAGTVRPGNATVPGQTIPLAQRFMDTSGNITTSFTVGSGVIQYVGGNLLNDYGNVGYEPNVADLPNHDIPPEEPLVFVSWSATDMTRPAWATPDVAYGPFIQIAPADGDVPAIVTPFSSPAGQPNSRNQLVTGPGVGGGPLVRVWDFTGQANGTIKQNEMIQFLAFDSAFRGGVNVSIGSFIDLPDVPNPLNPVVVPDTSGFNLAAVTFPFDLNIYRQYSAQIAVSPASGGGSTVIFSDFKPDPTTRRTSISQLNMVGTVLDTTYVADPTNALGGFISLSDVSSLNSAIDPQFRGQILTAASALLFDGSGATARAQNVFAAGSSSSGVSRGPRVRIFDNLGPSTTGLPNAPIDDFQAFLTGVFPNGVGGVSFGFGALPSPTLDIVELSSISVPQIVTGGIFIPPT